MAIPKLGLAATTLGFVLACGGGTSAADAPGTGPELTSETDGGAGSAPGSETVAPPRTATTKRPLEVFGPAGTTVSVTVLVRDPGAAPKLFIECHGCGYHDTAFDAVESKVKATVRINENPAVALKRYTGGDRDVGNRDIELFDTDAAYGGIGGAHRTVRMLVPAAGLVAGENIITFEHRDPSLDSIGFRVLDLDVRDNRDVGTTRLTAPALPFEDPAEWPVPVDEAAKLRGAELWSRRELLYDPFYDALDEDPVRGSGVANGRIRAACADCHARDGRDLKYFNYTDASIVARARFHELTASQGADIAAYIRALPLPVVPSARPWNPPYQPGPGLDARPAYEWAAGAGLQWVLDHDEDTRPWLFPAEDAQAVQAVASRFATLNLRQLPIAMQLPDWNQWLPRVHPLDAFDVGDAATNPVTQDEKGTGVGGPFFEVLYEQTRSTPDDESVSLLRERIENWLVRGASCFTQTAGNGPPFRSIDSVVEARVALPTFRPFDGRCVDTGPSEPDERHTGAFARPLELAKTGLAAWLSVKQWELVHTRADGETRSQTYGKSVEVPGRDAPIDASEARGWGLRGPSVFFRAPHYVGFNSDRFTHQDFQQGAHESSAWYHLQLLLNPGYRRTDPPPGMKNHPDPEMPSHFPYTIGFIDRLTNTSPIGEPFRFWATYIKIRQQQTNGFYARENGLDLRTAQAYLLVSDERSDVRSRDVGQPLWGELASSMVLDLAEAASIPPTAVWLEAGQNSTVQGYITDDAGNRKRVGCNDLTPYEEEGVEFDKIDASQATNTFRALPKLAERAQASIEARTALATWAERMWPLPASCAERWRESLR